MRFVIFQLGLCVLISWSLVDTAVAQPFDEGGSRSRSSPGRVLVAGTATGAATSGSATDTVRGRRAWRPRSGAEPVLEFSTKSVEDARSADGRTLLEMSGSWVYHIKNVDAAAVGACRASLAVIDYSADGSHARAFTRAEIERMKVKPGGGRMKIVAYMSIGEAENYRDLYWRRDWTGSARPSWLGPENPGWGGNFNVRYWDPQWQRLIFGGPTAYLDTLIANGFDGVYLDIIDGFEFWQDRERSPDGPRASAANEMIDFVTALARYAWSKAPGFLVIPQNGEALLRHPSYRAHISAIATEDVYFRGVSVPAGESRADDVERQPDAETSKRLGDLSLALAEKIPVLSVEYLMDQPEDMLQSQTTALRMRRRGLNPHFSVRQLDRLQCAMAN